MRKLVSWVEIPTENFDRAVDFYNSILNIGLEKVDCGEEKMACFPSGDGAVIYSPGYKPSKEGVIVSLNAENDLEGVMEKITKNGGAIVQPKTKIEVEGRGYFSIFIDSEGNKIGLYGD